MGKFVGKIHQHDMPRENSTKAGQVWECSCGAEYYLHEKSLVWTPVDKKNDIVTYDKE